MVNLKTERLILRNEKLEDAETLYKFLGCDAEMPKYTGWNPYIMLDSAKKKIEQDIQNSEDKNFYSWVIQFKDEIIGTIGAYDYEPQTNSIEIGYSIFRNAWGKGYATEALSEVIRYLFEDKSISRVHAWSHMDNTASQKVLEKAGMKREGIKKNLDGIAIEQVIYGILRDDRK